MPESEFLVLVPMYQREREVRVWGENMIDYELSG